MISKKRKVQTILSALSNNTNVKHVKDVLECFNSHKSYSLLVQQELLGGQIITTHGHHVSGKTSYMLYECLSMAEKGNTCCLLTPDIDGLGEFKLRIKLTNMCKVNGIDMEAIKNIVIPEPLPYPNHKRLVDFMYSLIDSDIFDLIFIDDILNYDFLHGRTSGIANKARNMAAFLQGIQQKLRDTNKTLYINTTTVEGVRGTTAAGGHAAVYACDYMIHIKNASTVMQKARPYITGSYMPIRTEDFKLFSFQV